MWKGRNLHSFFVHHSYQQHRHQLQCVRCRHQHVQHTFFRYPAKAGQVFQKLEKKLAFLTLKTATSKEHVAPWAPRVPNRDPEGRRGRALLSFVF